MEEVNLDALALLHDGDGQHHLSLHDVIVHDENLERNSEGIWVQLVWRFPGEYDAMDVAAMQLLLEKMKPVDKMFFISFAVWHLPQYVLQMVICVKRFHLYFGCMEKCDAALNVWNETKNYIFHLLHFGFDDREFVHMAFWQSHGEY